MRRLLIASIVALTLLTPTPVHAQGFWFYSGYYFTSWGWPFFGRQCYWEYGIYANGSGFYFDTCGGSVGWF